MKKFAAALAILGLLTVASCDDRPQKQYETTSQARWDTMTIEVHWVGKTEISETCQGLASAGNPETGLGGGTGEFNGCAQSKPGDNKVCEIYATQPEDFDDADKLKVFGHEAWHCFGAQHR